PANSNCYTGRDIWPNFPQYLPFRSPFLSTSGRRITPTWPIKPISEVKRTKNVYT
ncbi:hypothetical protein M441DRAFT_128231, partial [Trichoderma asperellum CBS 433.97]